MKELVENIMINGVNQDVVIDYWMRPQKDENNKIVWANAKDNIGKCKGWVSDVIVYLKDADDYSKVSAVRISPYAIKQLYANILEIEAKESEEFID